MIKKTATEEGKDWDNLPYLLLSTGKCRKSPQVSRPLSCYMGDVCGPLEVLKETWTEDDGGDQNMLSYILLMREKLDKMNTQAQVNLRESSAQQKT